MMMETAYLAVIVPHVKKPATLADLLLPVDDRARGKQTPEQRLAAADAWASAMSRN